MPQLFLAAKRGPDRFSPLGGPIGLALRALVTRPRAALVRKATASVTVMEVYV